ncbi:Hint domain-containing protein [Lichenicola sp.]|uniref:Hint domain-containing protein n=1 Tax=Lichenicola sp. TaxID=2804529 RepID=UPI003B00BA99
MTNQFVSSGTSVSGVVVAPGDTLDVLYGGLTLNALVSSGGSDIIAGDGLDTTLLAFATEVVSAGGTAIATSVGALAAQFVYSDGTAIDTIVASGGEAFVLSGGLAYEAEVRAGGYLSISAGGTASASVLSAGGTQLVMSGGMAQDTFVSGGFDTISAGGVASASMIDSGGIETVLSGGDSIAAGIGSGGYLVVSAGGEASGGTVSSGGYIRVSAGGITRNDVISSGGTEIVLSGGVASGTTIGAFGMQVLSAGGTSIATVVDSGGYEIVSAGGTASGTTIGYGGEAYVLSNGLAQGAIVSSGGYLAVSSGGAALGTTVENGGTEALGNGAVASGGVISGGGVETASFGAETIGDTVESGGYLVLSAGGVADDTQVGSGGFLLISSGAAASGAVVSSGGLEVVSAGGLALATMLLSGGGIQLDDLAFASGGQAVLDADTDTLVVTEGGRSVDVALQGSYDGLYFRLSDAADGATIITAEGTPCYGRGTLIRTDTGDVPVEGLRIGDMLVTASGAMRPLRWIGRRSYDRDFAAGKSDILPVMVRAGALADGVPRRDLFVSPLHALFLDGHLVAAMLLVNGSSIRQAGAIDTVEYFHLELDEHDILLAENAPAESFIDDGSRGMFHNAGEYTELYPQAVPQPARYCAPHLEAGEALEVLRERLAVRARSAAPVAPAGRTPLDGHLDQVDHQMIRGWAREPDGAVARLRILDNGRTIGIVDADLLRPDLVVTGIGDGRHAFEFAVPGGLDPRVRHVIQVQRVLGGAELGSSPVFLDPAADDADGSGPHVLPVLADAEVEDGRYGHLDRVERGLIKGWAWNRLEPNHPVAVQVFADGHLLVRVVANAYRHDLAAAGIGSGRHGFEVELPAELSPRSRHVLHVRIENSHRELLGSPVAIEPATAFDGTLEKVVADAVGSLAGAPDRNRVLSFLLSEADRVRQQMADDDASRVARDRTHRERRLQGPHADASQPMRRALVIDERTPSADRDAGSQALLSHMQALQELGYAVSFAATEDVHTDGPAAQRLREQGVTVCGAPVYGSVEDLLRRQANCFDVVYLHRIATASAYMALARRHMPAARLIYSVADLHHVRLSRQAKAERRPELLGLSHRLRLEECTAAWQAHAVLTHSPVEADLLRRAVPAAAVYEVPWAVAVDEEAVDAAGGPDFTSRAGVAFIGHYGHAPNEDAACWLVETIMPLVWARDPSIPCLLAGSDITPRIHALGRPGVEILGHVADLAPLWRRVRLSAAPLRFGAGIKGKVLNSLGAGVPCLMTALAAEGLTLSAPLREALVADEAEALADRICRLHADAGLHATARAEGLRLIRRRHGRATVRDALQTAIDGCRPAAAAASAA